jgi:hypothetical protein
MCYDYIVKSAFDSYNLLAKAKPGPHHSHDRPVARGYLGRLPTYKTTRPCQAPTTG